MDFPTQAELLSRYDFEEGYFYDKTASPIGNQFVEPDDRGNAVILGRLYPMAPLAWIAMYGSIPKGKRVYANSHRLPYYPANIRCL